MLAGDIIIGKDLIIGTGDSLIVALFLLMLITGVAIFWHDHWAEKKYDDRLVREAKNTRIAEDVTLIEGIRAYFGVEGVWSKPFLNEVDILTTLDGWPRAGIRVVPTIGKVDVLTFRREKPPEGKNEPELLLGLMIQAAREQRESSQP